MTKQLTTTTATPIRISAEYYQIESQSKDRLGRVYDLRFRHELKRWICNCPDKERNGNPRCKHARRLVAWIKEQEEAQQKIQAEAAALVEQAFAQAGPEPHYREYAPPKQAPTYFTELDSRLAQLEGRMQANECEAALIGNQLAELVKADGDSFATIDRWMMQEAEKREALAHELEAVRAEMQAVRTELTGKIDAVYHVLFEDANGIRKHNGERYRKQQEEIAQLSTQVAELSQIQPVRISTQEVRVESKNGVKGEARPHAHEPAARGEIKEIQRDGRFVGFEIDGYEVRVAHGMVMGCRCPDGQDKPCKHAKAAEEHLAKRRETAPLGEKKAFSLMR